MAIILVKESAKIRILHFLSCRALFGHPVQKYLIFIALTKKIFFLKQEFHIWCAGYQNRVKGGCVEFNSKGIFRKYLRYLPIWVMRVGKLPMAERVGALLIFKIIMTDIRT